MDQGWNSTEKERVVKDKSIAKIIFVSIFIFIIFAIYFWTREGGTTHLKIEMKDNRYTVYLDGKKISSVDVNIWSSGAIGYKQHVNTVPIIPQKQRLKKIIVTDLDTDEILLSENFEEKEINKKKWRIYSENWKIKGDSITANDEDAVIVSRKSFKNITYEADIDTLSGADLLFRVQDSNNFLYYTIKPLKNCLIFFFTIS